MTPQQRILATVNREPVDRVPVDVWLTPEVLQSLLEYTGVTDEYALYSKLGVDKIAWNFPGYQSDKFDPNDSTGLDPWGVPTFKVKSGLATYQEYGDGPLADYEEVEELDDYALWPKPGEFNYAAARKLAEQAREHGFATIGPWLSQYEIYCHLRGMEEALMDTISEPEFLEAGLARIHSIQTTMLKRYLTEMGDLVDLVFISDDLGTQSSQLISMQAFEQHLKPRLAEWCELIHGFGKKVLFHTDGAAQAFIPHLIEAGVDILNPVQHRCPGMECAGLNDAFGDKVIFHGGIENQEVLPFGSVEDVRAEVTHCMQTLGKDGGYIPSSCHNIQAGTPPENVVAMIEAVQNWKV